jgi:hypothetical protein
MDPVTIIDPAAASMLLATPGPLVRALLCETVRCRRRCAASSVGACFGRGVRSSGCVNASNVDERIATD